MTAFNGSSGSNAGNGAANLLQFILGAVSGGSSTVQNNGTTATQGTNSQDVIQNLIRTLTGTQQTTGGSTSTQTGGSTQTQTGGSTSTTRSDITAAGIQKMLTDALSASGTGIADIATGSKVAGIYNGTTQQMLTNDLLSRTAGELAKARAGTTTTTSNTGSTNTTNSTVNNSTNTQTQTTNQSENTQNNTNTQGTNNTNVTNANTQTQNTESPLRNIDISALLGAGGAGLLTSLLGPALGQLFNTGTGTTGGIAGGVNQLGQLLASLFDPNRVNVSTDGSGNPATPNTPGTNIGTVGDLRAWETMWDNILNDINLNSDTGLWSPVDNSVVDMPYSDYNSGA